MNRRCYWKPKGNASKGSEELPIKTINKSERTPKLWRDYAGIVPSQELADSFKELGEFNEMQKGLASAKAQFA
jgi:hypothetical protein